MRCDQNDGNTDSKYKTKHAWFAERFCFLLCLSVSFSVDKGDRGDSVGPFKANPNSAKVYIIVFSMLSNP